MIVTREPVLVYDGDCSFCQRWVARFKRWESADTVRLLPLQDPEALELTSRTPEQLSMAMCLVLPDGRSFDGADAVRELTRYLRGGGLLRLGFALPGTMPIARRVYSWIAGRRYELGCGGEHCSVPVAKPDGG